MLNQPPNSRQFVQSLKKDISDFIVNFKKRYNLFPWKQIEKLKKVKGIYNHDVTIKERDYTVRESFEEIHNRKSNIEKNLNPISYNPILLEFIKKSFKLSGNELNELYLEYKDKINAKFEESREDLYFCLDALKSLNRIAKDINIQESVQDSNNISNPDKYTMVINGEIHETGVSGIYDKLLSKLKPEYFICEFAYEDKVLTREELKDRIQKATKGKYIKNIPDYYDNYWVYELAYKHNCKLIGCNPYELPKSVKTMEEEDKIREAYMLKVLKEYKDKKCLVQLGDHHLRSIPITKEYLSFIKDKGDSRGKYKDMTVSFASPIYEYFSNDPKCLICRNKELFEKEQNYLHNINESEGNVMNDTLLNIYRESVLDEIVADFFLESRYEAERELDYLEAMESYFEENDDEDEVATEGTNTDSKLVYKAFKRDFNDAYKSYRSHMRNGEYARAKASVVKMRAALKATEIRLKGLKDESLLTAIKGFFLFWLKKVGVVLIAALGGAIAGHPIIAGSGAATIVALKGAVSFFDKIINDYNDGQLSLDSINAYRDDIFGSLKVYDKAIDYLDNKIGAAMKSDIKSKVYGESYSYEAVNDEGELVDTHNIIIEAYEYLDDIDGYDDEDDEELTEGANTDTHNEYKGFKKEYKELRKKFKQAMKSNDFATARGCLDKMESNIDKTIKAVDAIKSPGALSAAKGWLIESIRSAIMSLITLIPIVGAPALFIIKLKEFIDVIVRIVKDVKNNEFTVDTLNIYRTRILAALKQAKTTIKALRASVKQKK